MSLENRLILTFKCRKLFRIQTISSRFSANSSMLFININQSNLLRNVLIDFLALFSVLDSIKINRRFCSWTLEMCKLIKQDRWHVYIFPFTRITTNIIHLINEGNRQKSLKKKWNVSWICVSSLLRDHANLLCIVPILVYGLLKWAPEVLVSWNFESITLIFSLTR